MTKYNVIWIYVDSVRRYHSTSEAIKAGDDRSRLKMMDEFAKEAVEFENTVTSAPSTQMSISAMAASLPSYYLASNFSDYFTDNFATGNLTDEIKENGYSIYGFLQSKRSREFNLKVFTPIKRKYWPNGFSHTQYWDNTMINLAIDKALNYKLDKPAFFFVNYNCRKDPDISDKVEWAINRFKEAGYNENNTITILCSDHGYPDASKESGNPNFYTENNLTHDLLLTDDNIMIPLFIQYPKCPKGKKIKTTISSLDIFPTVFDILSLKNKYEIVGKSSLPLADDQNNVDEYTKRFHRTDCRLKSQSGRGTSIRNDEWKYIFYHDDLRKKGPEEFFNIVKDPQEILNLISSNDKQVQKNLKLFREEFEKSELKAKRMHTDFKSVRKNFFYRAKREVLFAIPFLKQEPMYFFKFVKSIVTGKRIKPPRKYKQEEHDGR